MSTEIKEYGLPFKYIVGPGSLGELGRYAPTLGKKAFVGVGQGSMKRSGVLDRALRALRDGGVDSAVFEGIEPDPSTATVDRGVAFARERGCDLFIGLGGGSVLDAVKAIAILTQHEGQAKQYQMAERALENPCPPVVCIPSTSGTGSEASKVVVLTNEDTGIKKAFYSFDMVSRLAILDPEITALMPQELTGLTALDALGHALEGYVSTGATPISKAAAYQAIVLIGQNLKAVLKDGSDLAAREHLAMAAFLGGIALMGSVGTCHEMAMALGSFNKTAHGLAVAFFTLPCMRANRDHCPRELAEIAYALGVDARNLSETDAAEAGLDAIQTLIDMVGIPGTLSDLGMGQQDVAEFLHISKISTSIKTNPRPMDDALRTEILGSLFAGRTV